MKIIKTEGIVINEQNYSESSKILKVFTKEYGVISVLSKGCRKLKSNLKEASTNLTYANFDISYKKDGLSTLIGADIIKIFKNIIMDYHDLAKKMYAFIITDLTSQVINQKQIDEDEIKEIYDILIPAITKIDAGLNPSVILDIVMLKYLKFLGVLPSLDACSNCGSKSNIVTIDAKSFGFICKDCYTNELIVNDSALKLVRMLYYSDINRIKTLDNLDGIEDVHNFIQEYYESQTGIYMNIKKKIVALNKMQGVL